MSELEVAPSFRKRHITKTMRSQSPPNSALSTHSRSVECKAMLATTAHRCNLQLSPEFTVDEAIAQATTQVLRDVVDGRGSRGCIGEKLSVVALPSATGTTTVAEWVRMNMGKPPVVVFESDASADRVAKKSEVNSAKWGKVEQDHAQMMTDLKKLLQAQVQTIERQAAFIDDLQARDLKMSELFGKTVARVQGDIANMKGDLLQLEERMVSTSVENGKQPPD